MPLWSCLCDRQWVEVGILVTPWFGATTLRFSMLDERVPSLCLQIVELVLTVIYLYVLNDNSVYLTIWEIPLCCSGTVVDYRQQQSDLEKCAWEKPLTPSFDTICACCGPKMMDTRGKVSCQAEQGILSGLTGLCDSGVS